jgi:hypothetical protein
MNEITFELDSLSFSFLFIGAIGVVFFIFAYFKGWFETTNKQEETKSAV